MVAKSPDAFRTISEVAEDLDLPQHVLRFWETRFTQIKPLKRGGGRRYYRPDDIDLLRGIRFFLYGEGYTIRGVQRILKEQGPRFVTAAGRGEFPGLPGRRGSRDEAPPPEAEDDGDEDAPTLRREPAFAATPRARGPVPAFDVEREDHDPDDAPEHVIDDEDPEDMEEGARRMAARFAPERPQPVGPPRPQARDTAPPRATANAEPRRPAPVDRPPNPRPPQPAPAGSGLDPEDAEALKATLVELLELKRLLDQAR
jgi:DNA-binding transcriptional MerR regulator